MSAHRHSSHVGTTLHTVARSHTLPTQPPPRVQKWFACIANAQFMLNDVQNESFAEQLREKTRYYREKGLDLDYFLVCDPAWLDEQHLEEAKKVQRPCVALVGQEESWIRCGAPPAAPHACCVAHVMRRARAEPPAPLEACCACACADPGQRVHAT